MEPNQALEKIIQLMESDQQVEMNQDTKSRLTLLLKQLYGSAYQAGIEQGASVTNQFELFKNR
ncbi:hypothetical protein [Aquibacillus sediminis]|uniref:hypothetical protein n=1 Tax=Aquibacillus sediminis TaxID=2574734 RepID=UPI0011099D4F|nr:hypothetical protein [Aquibacillus sediminis]